MLTLVNQSKISFPKKFVEAWMQEVRRGLKLKNQGITIVFLDPLPAKKLNKQFRGKDYATDILSFDGEEPGQLGELILCPMVLKAQAKEHGHSFKAELGYMLIHGVLHLLGYDHEKSKKEAAQMFKIQDQLFDRLCAKFEI